MIKYLNYSICTSGINYFENKLRIYMNKLTRSHIFNSPFLSFLPLIGFGLQLLSFYMVLNFIENGLLSRILNILAPILQILSVIGIVLGIIQISKIKRKIFPIIGIILNSIWLVAFLGLIYWMYFLFVPR